MIYKWSKGGQRASPRTQPAAGLLCQCSAEMDGFNKTPLVRSYLRAVRFIKVLLLWGWPVRTFLLDQAMAGDSLPLYIRLVSPPMVPSDDLLHSHSDTYTEQP